MARIDRFIAALFDRGADALRFDADARVALVRGESAKPVTSAALDAKMLAELVDEIAPAELADEIEQPGDHAFGYASPSGDVALRITRGGEWIHRIEITPGGAPAAAPAPPAAPQEPEAAPAATPEPAAPASAQATAAPAPVQTAAAQPELSGDAVTPGPATAEMDRLFQQMVGEGCSDLHLSSASPPLFRKDGGMAALAGTDVLPPDRVRAMLMSITPPKHQQIFDDAHDADFSYEIPGLARFRCNLFVDRNGAGGVFRVIPDEILTSEQLGLSSQLLELCHLHKGLVVVTGPTGSGKSTTLAAMIDYINRNRSAHIITIEDPIEFVHPNKQCLINQREIGNHTLGFKPALRAALREDPDIVLVGEMRDLETVEIAIETAETGHLVFGTLHTNTAASTVDRVIDQFPTDRQSQVRAMLASSLKGVIAQNLCKKQGGGRVAALEVLIVNAAVSNLIREGKTFQIGSVMQTGKKLGMMTLAEALMALVEEGLVEPAEAYAKSVDRNEFGKLLTAKGYEFEAEDGGDA